MAHEVELKLRIRPADAARLKRHPAVIAATRKAPVTRKLTSIYYDTPQLTLLDAGLSLRVRRMSGQWFQAVKGAGAALAGLHQRPEWEDIIAHGTPDFSKITAPALTRVFDDSSLRDALRPIFTTEIRRTEWQLQYADSQLEMALDLGSLVANGNREPISELELELKSGVPAALFQFALLLQADIPLWIENVSKAQRGYAHYRPRLPTVTKARHIALKPGMTAAEAFRSIAWECLAHLQGNHEMVLHGDDIEGVHQMRVALRRLRAAFAVFRDTLPVADIKALRADIGWIGDTLGKARDLDVFLHESLPPLRTALPDHAGLARLQSRAEHARQSAYATLREALESQRYQRLLLTLGAWLENPAWQETPQRTVKLQQLAARTLDQRHRRLRRQGKRLAEMPPQERHVVRIAAKKLRYATEFFSSLYPSRKTRPYLRSLAALQDVLGVLNDIAVTAHLVESLVGARRSRLLDEAIALLTGWNARHGYERLSHLDAAWHSFAQHDAFWK